MQSAQSPAQAALLGVQRSRVSPGVVRVDEEEGGTDLTPILARWGQLRRRGNVHFHALAPPLARRYERCAARAPPIFRRAEARALPSVAGGTSCRRTFLPLLLCARIACCSLAASMRHLPNAVQELIMPVRECEGCKN